MVFVDFSTNCVLAVGGIDASRGAVLFAETLKNIGTFHRREASMPPLQCFLTFPKQTCKQQFSLW